jgi:NDP-sugar pyrophosphorylase family protein
MLNIVVPMAGRGSRFAREGYALPKPLIPVHGVPMIRLVIDNLRPACEHRFVFLCLREHLRDHAVEARLRQWAPGCQVLSVDRTTEGAACTVLLAKDLIDNGDPLMIANSDQYVDADIERYLGAMETSRADGLIMTMRSDDPKWSFVRFDPAGRIVEVVEKEVVSNEATVGIYNFREGRRFVDAAQEMIGKDLRVNGEFYVAPAYNQMIARGLQIVHFNVGAEMHGMYGLGIPSDLRRFEAAEVSRRAVRGLPA